MLYTYLGSKIPRLHRVTGCRTGTGQPRFLGYRWSNPVNRVGRSRSLEEIRSLRCDAYIQNSNYENIHTQH